MKLELFPLPGLSLTRFLSMIYFKQRFVIDHQPLLDSTSGTCQQAIKSTKFGPHCGGPKSGGANSIQLWKHRQCQQPPTPDALLERYLIYTNYVILYLLFDIS